MCSFASNFGYDIIVVLKGNPVEVRNYPRSCKFQKKPCAKKTTVPRDGKVP
jgi:hypothetical protein